MLYYDVKFEGTTCNSRERISNSRERIAIRENGLSNSRERIAIRENELFNSRERITNPWERITNAWERIAQFDITIYLWLFLKIPMSLQGFRINQNYWISSETVMKTFPWSLPSHKHTYIGQGQNFDVDWKILYNFYFQ